MTNVIIYQGTGIVETIAIAELKPIEDVLEDGYLVAREIDPEHVERLVIAELKDVPPIEIVRTNNGTAIIDGRHRVGAAILLKRASIQAIARPYASEAQVIEAAFQANLKHGKGASKGTRSTYAAWLYYQDESGKPNLSAIARKVGLNVSTVSRAVHKALKNEQEEQEAREQGMNKAEADNAAKLIAALQRFYESERALFGSGAGQRDIKARAKVLAYHLQRLDREKQKQTVRMLQSIQETLAVFESTYVHTTAPKKIASR